MKKKANGAKKAKAAETKPARRKLGEVALVLRVPKEAVAYIDERAGDRPRTAFVREVLDTASGESLASTERYGTALDWAGESNAGQLYVDIVRLLDIAVAAMPADDQAFYRRELAPYLEPLQAGAASVSAGDRLSVRLVVTVKEPGR